jgi:fructose-1,6-bisphosphatase/sedoheptulose 1,7-bisphosphatase-like protein
MTESLTVNDYAAKLATVAKGGSIELKRTKGPNGETIIQSADVNALAGLLAAKVDLSASILKPHIDEWKAARVI